MDRVILAEVLDRHGDVRQRVRIERLPFSIGRAYTNDLILDDPHVCPQHACLEHGETGEVLVRDLDSLNGVHVTAVGRVRSFDVGSGVDLRIGRTEIRLRCAAHPMAPTVPDERGRAAVQWLTSHWSAALLALVGVYVYSVIAGYRSTYSEIEPLELLSEPGMALLVIVGWAGAWALVSRLLSHHARFVAHLVIACSYVVATGLADQVWFLMRFLAFPIAPIQVLEFVASVAFVALALFAHLTAAGTLQRIPRLAAATLVAVGVLGIRQLSDVSSRPMWVNVLPYWSRLLPIDPAWLPTETPEQFFAGARSLQGEVDALAREAD